jgi:hypothetical protein
LYVAFSRAKSPGNPSILLHDDMDDFIIRPPIGIDAVQILRTMQSSRPLPIPQLSLGNHIESGISSIEPSEVTLSDELSCPDGYFDAPEDPICCVPSLDHDAVELFNPYTAEISLNVQTISGIHKD